MGLLYASACFEHCCAHHQEVKIALYREDSLNLCTGRPPTDCDGTRCCIMQFWQPDDEHKSGGNM